MLSNQRFHYKLLFSLSLLGLNTYLQQPASTTNDADEGGKSKPNKQICSKS